MAMEGYQELETLMQQDKGECKMISGSCLCGGVKYDITGEIGAIVHCHCPTCRKTHATAFSSVANVALDGLTFTQGQGLLKHFESSSGKKRYFCSHCGSHIYAKRDDQDHFKLRLGTLDGDPQLEQGHHIWLSEKAPWYDIDEVCQLPRFETWAE